MKLIEEKLKMEYIEIPDVLPLPAQEVSLNTRKGVIFNYMADSAKA